MTEGTFFPSCFVCGKAVEWVLEEPGEVTRALRRKPH